MVGNALYAMGRSFKSTFRTVRWALRSPHRVVGLVALLFAVYELFSVLGVFDFLWEVYLGVLSWVVHVRTTLVESSETI